MPGRTTSTSWACKSRPWSKARAAGEIEMSTALQALVGQVEKCWENGLVSYGYPLPGAPCWIEMAKFLGPNQLGFNCYLRWRYPQSPDFIPFVWFVCTIWLLKFMALGRELIPHQRWRYHGVSDSAENRGVYGKHGAMMCSKNHGHL